MSAQLERHYPSGKRYTVVTRDIQLTCNCKHHHLVRNSGTVGFYIRTLDVTVIIIETMFYLLYTASSIEHYR